VTDYGSRAERWVAQKWPAIRARGMWRFVLLKGVAFWGGLMFAFLAIMMLVQFGAVAGDAGASFEVLGVGRYQRHFAGVFTLVERMPKGFGQALVGVGLSVGAGLFCACDH